jgi:hypothetical protein
MQKQFLSSLFILTALVSQAQTKKFEGSFFSVSYPSNFKATKCSDPNFCNSVTLTSPDKTVQFYIFSPQWNGEPNVSVTATEKEVSRKESEVNGVTITEVTISAKNGSYTRSYYDAENKELNTRYCFGIKYKNIAAYNKFKAQYIAFKKSLEQFAD